MQIRLFEEKELLGIGGEDLLTRPIARRFVPNVISKLKQIIDTNEAIEFNFEKIKTSDTSFVDELIIVHLLQGMKNRKINRRGIFVTRLSDSSLDNINSVFSVKKIPLLFKTENREFKLLGHLEKNLIHLLKLLIVKKHLRAADVSKEFNFALSVASTKLSKLHQLCLANRVEEISEKGREYNYYSVF